MNNENATSLPIIEEQNNVINLVKLELNEGECQFLHDILEEYATPGSTRKYFQQKIHDAVMASRESNKLKKDIKQEAVKTLKKAKIPG